MTAILISANVLVATGTLAAVAAVCRLGYALASGAFDARPEPRALPVRAHELGRAA